MLQERLIGKAEKSSIVQPHTLPKGAGPFFVSKEAANRPIARRDQDMGGYEVSLLWKFVRAIA